MGYYQIPMDERSILLTARTATLARGSLTHRLVEISVIFHDSQSMTPHLLRQCRVSTLTSFVIGNDHYKFCWMSFRLCNAPQSFQRTVDSLFKGINCVRTYLDDILVMSKSKEQHAKELEKVFSVLRTKGASVNFQKSRFGLDKIVFLCQIISANRIQPDVKRIKDL